MNWPLDHVGIATDDLDKSISQYQKDLSFKLEHRELVKDQKVEVAFLRLENTLIELIAPIDDSSPIAKFLSTRGPGLHHICYRVADIRAELSKLAALGYKLIDETPRVGAKKKLIAFIHPKSFGGVLTELCQHV